MSDESWMVRNHAFFSIMWGCIIIWVYGCIFRQFSHLYMSYTSTVYLLLFKVAKPKPKTWVCGHPNPKQVEYSRPGLESLVLCGVWTPLHQTWWGHKAIMATQEVCFRVWISCCIFKCRQLNVEWFASDVEKDAKLRTFWPRENYGRGGRDLYTNCWRYMTEPPEHIWRPSTASLLSALYW